MARKAKTDANGRPLPTTPFVHLGGRDVPVEELTPRQLEIWQSLHEAEHMPVARIRLLSEVQPA